MMAAHAWLRRPRPSDHKYRRGVLAVRTGSVRYPGAAVLTVSAAWRTGLGMVRYTVAHEQEQEQEHRHDASGPAGLPAPSATVITAHPETIIGREDGTAGAMTDPHTDAWLLGSGTDSSDRPREEHDALVAILNGDRPCVVDAGALELVAELRTAGTAGAAASDETHTGAPLLLTPHLGEYARLRSAARLPEDPDGDDLTRLATTLGATILLKGSVTRCAAPGWDAQQVLSTAPATPWLATAGTGDVLAGIAGALLAAHADRILQRPEELADLGIAAASLHDSAARIAAGDPGGTGNGRPITALDLAKAVPEAVAALRNTAR